MDATQVLEEINPETLKFNHSRLWDNMPDIVSGEEWRAEIILVAQRLADYDITEDNLSDVASEIADGYTQDYYINIANRFHSLGLWASDDLDAECIELADGRSKTANEMMSLYLYCAMRGLAHAVGEYALEVAQKAVTA